LKLHYSKGKLPSDDHERRLFDLSKAVWGSTTIASSSGSPRTVAEMCTLYPYLMEDVTALHKEHPGLLKQSLLIGDDKARDLNRNIKKQRLDEAKVHVRRCDLTKEVTNSLLDFLKSPTV
jgi:hypothetical protein